MTTEIVLTSATTHLHIKLETDNCSFTHAPDGSILNVEAPDESFILSSELFLKNAHDEEVRTHYSQKKVFKIYCIQIWSASLASSDITGSGLSNHARIRVDSIFPLVFKKDELFAYCHPLILSIFELPTFALTVKLVVSSEKQSSDDLPHLEDIHSVNIVVGAATISVSKELLLLSSQFFDRLFNGNYSEKSSGVYEIKEIPEDDFRWFIDSFHRRNWEFSSREFIVNLRSIWIKHASLLNTLTSCLATARPPVSVHEKLPFSIKYCDRFGLLYLHSRVLPFLKSKKLPNELIKETLILCAKFQRIDDLMAWVLAQCGGLQNALQLMPECSQEMSAASIQLSFQILSVISQTEQEEAKKRNNEEMQSIMNKLQYSINDVQLFGHFRFHDENGQFEYHKWNAMHLHDNGRVREYMVWGQVPEKCQIIVIKGSRKSRSNNNMRGHYYFDNNALMVIDVFIE